MIRQLRPENDIKRVAEIWLNESIRVHNFVPDPENFWRKEQPGFIQETLAADAYVYEEDRLIKGFLTIENTYILAVYVELHCQNKGIGTSLLNLAKCCGESLHLHVFVKNIDSINWYLKHGFKIANKIVSKKPEGELKYVMVWSKSLALVTPS
jgi:putative acetyltransferase